MCDMLKILERELANTGLIYVYRNDESGKWYTYEQSAFLLNKMVGEGLCMERFVLENTLWFARAEVKVEQLPGEAVISVSRDEYVLHFVAREQFYQWLEKMENLKTETA